VDWEWDGEGGDRDSGFLLPQHIVREQARQTPAGQAVAQQTPTEGKPTSSDRSSANTQTRLPPPPITARPTSTPSPTVSLPPRSLLPTSAGS